MVLTIDNYKKISVWPSCGIITFQFGDKGRAEIYQIWKTFISESLRMEFQPLVKAVIWRICLSQCLVNHAR